MMITVISDKQCAARLCFSPTAHSFTNSPSAEYREEVMSRQNCNFSRSGPQEKYRNVSSSNYAHLVHSSSWLAPASIEGASPQVKLVLAEGD